MSEQQKQWLCRWLNVRDSLLRATFTRKGVPLSERDSSTWAETLVLLGLLVSDLSLQCSSNESSVIQWVKRLAQLDVFDVCTAMKKADAQLIQYYEDTDADDYFAFKQVLADINPAVTAVAAPFRKDLIEFFRFGDVRVFKDLHQAFAYISHVSLVDIDDNDELIQQFVMRDVGLTNPDPVLANELNEVMVDVLANFHVETLPSHGTGATAETGRSSLFKKYLYVGTDQLLSYVLKKHGYNPNDYIVNKTVSWDRTSKLQCVPKTALTRRTICMEPVTCQFYQHMVFDALADFFDSSPLIKRHIQLTHQEVNRWYAYQGSFGGSYATVDLSAASDSVSWALIKSMFKHTTLLPWLYATRSRRVRIDDDRILPLKKFAGMGSALCFPVMCLVIFGVCENIRRKNGKRGKFFDYHVYGDDIVCTSNMVDDVVRDLQRIGFKVNLDKTFTRVTSNVFRESCGGEYLGGVSVSPLRISRRFVAGELTPDHPDRIENYRSFANLLFSRGFLRSRQWILHSLLKLAPDFRPIFGSGCGHVHTYDPTNYQHSRRWNRRYQRLEYRALGVKIERDPIDETASLVDHRLVVPEKSTELSSEALLREEVRYLHYWLSTLSPHQGCKPEWDSWKELINNLLSKNSCGRAEIGQIRSITGNRSWVPAFDYSREAVK